MPRLQQQLETLLKLAVQAEYQPGKLATLAGCTPWQLRRKLLRLVGCSTRVFLRRLRIKHAEAKLLSSSWVKEIAPEICFKHSASLCRWFKKEKGVPITQFLKTTADQ